MKKLALALIASFIVAAFMCSCGGGKECPAYASNNATTTEVIG